LKLRALKVAESNLKHEAHANAEEMSARPASARPLVNQKKLNAYRYEIVKTRQERNKEVKLFKNLTEQIIETWKELKDLRQKQQFRNTQVKLTIRKYAFRLFFSSL
jgi:hypothetical protein